MILLLRRVLGVFVLLTLVTGVIYPLAVTGVAAVAFPEQATGSVVSRDGRAIGSALLGQPFSGPRYFWSRPSATTPQPYNGGASTGTNQSATNPALAEAVAARVAALRAADPQNTAPVPVDLVTASASGLDPHISPAAAEFQATRVARTRGLDVARVRELVAAHTLPRTLGVLGEPRVDVLALNLALDAAQASAR
jgi:K+-transporting ATPase ATPase C chain